MLLCLKWLAALTTNCLAKAPDAKDFRLQTGHADFSSLSAELQVSASMQHADEHVQHGHSGVGHSTFSSVSCAARNRRDRCWFILARGATPSACQRCGLCCVNCTVSRAATAVPQHQTVTYQLPCAAAFVVAPSRTSGLCSQKWSGTPLSQLWGQAAGNPCQGNKPGLCRV